MKESVLGQVAEMVTEKVNDERVAEMLALIPDQ